jgi:hypothetical protein
MIRGVAWIEMDATLSILFSVTGYLDYSGIVGSRSSFRI